MLNSFLIAFVSLGLAADTGNVPWHHALSYDGGGYWNTRVPLRCANESADALDGAPVNVLLEAKTGTGALLGAPVSSLRAVDASGAELLFDLVDEHGLEKRSGTLAEGDAVFVPLHAAAHETRTVFLYAGNAKAWLPPEWLRVALTNGGFESGEPVPESWTPVLADADHRLALDHHVIHDGTTAARCEVDAGAAPAWVKYLQQELAVLPGQKYRFTAWVKAVGVQGNAGWYVHVNGAQGILLNQGAGSGGTYDWRELTIDFEAPAGAQTLECGTVLNGTGTAWYDDASLQLLSGGGVRTEILPAEPCTLAQSRTEAWPANAAWAWRAPLLVRNYAETPLVNGLLAFNTARANNGFAKAFGFAVPPALAIIDPEQPDQPLAYAGELRGSLQVQCNVPARTEKTLWLCAGRPGTPGASTAAALTDWANAPLNLAVNGTMEDGEEGTPAAWLGANPGKSEPFQAARVKGGVTGTWCLQLNIPKDPGVNGWYGWRQKIPVKPNTAYLLSGHVKCEGLAGKAGIYGHLLRADGSLTQNPFFGTTPEVSGTEDWRNSTAAVLTPADCAFLEIHLTTNQQGTLWHDALLLTEVSEGSTGVVEARTVPAAPFQAWTVNPLVKVFQEDPPPALPHQAIDIATARNSYEAFQVALRSRAGGEARITASPLTGPNGAALDAPAVSRVGFVPVDFPIGYDNSTAPAYQRLVPRVVGCDGWAGYWPDPMETLTDGRLNLAPEMTQPIIFDVHVPTEAAPGVYTGTVEVACGGEALRLPVQLTVWDVALPELKHLPALLDLRNGPGESFLYGPGAEEQRKRWWRFLARYNVSPSLVDPYPGFTYENGEVRMDTARFDELMQYLLDELHVPKVYVPDLFYACGWAYRPKPIFGLEAFSPEYNAAWRSAYTQFINHITERGWRGRFVHYLSDEPFKNSEDTLRDLDRLADLAREIAPDVPIYSSTWEYIPGLANHLTLWGAGPQGSFDPKAMEERKKAGDHFWYTTDGQMCTDTPLLGIESLLPWFCFRYGMEAFEFWGVAWWTYDPWKYGWHTYIPQSNQGKEWYRVRYPNGDGFLAYPPRTGTEPVPTIRLTAIREGVEDYELFLLLRERADQGDAQAQALVERVHALAQMPNRGGRYSSYLMPDPDAVMQVRRAVGECVERTDYVSKR